MKNETQAGEQKNAGLNSQPLVARCIPGIDAPPEALRQLSESATMLPHSCLMSGRTFKRYSTVLCSLLAGLAALVRLQATAAEPDYNAPWTETPKKDAAPKKTEKAAPTKSGVSKTPAGTTTTSVNEAPATESQAALPMLDTKTVLRPPKPAKHEVSASGDFFFGNGTVSVPFGYSLKQSLGASASANVTPVAASANRTSEYIGGTISYSYGQAWYLDFSLLHGQLTANSDVAIPNAFLNGVANAKLSAKFDITDDWYQAYVRYTFPKLRGKPVSAYLRAGFSYVQAQLTANGDNFAYSQNDDTTDFLGSIGAGLAYNIYTGRRLRLYLQVEAEGFGGTRSQQSTEKLPLNIGQTPTAATIDNTLYGGIGRGTIRLEYRLGRSGLFKIFADGGIQGKFTQLSYPDIGSTSEYFWGPYIKVGARYAF